MSRAHVVLTAIGTDRPGLVREISALIHRAGCNLEDSRMAVLAREFALIVLFSGTPEAVAAVKRESRALAQSLALTVSFKDTTRPAAPAEARRFELEVKGVDQPGIVSRVSDVVADLGVNVASLESRLEHAAFSGTPLFVLHAELEVRDLEVLPRLRARLEDTGEKLGLSVALEPLAGAPDRT